MVLYSRESTPGQSLLSSGPPTRSASDLTSVQGLLPPVKMRRSPSASPLKLRLATPTESPRYWEHTPLEQLRLPRGMTHSYSADYLHNSSSKPSHHRTTLGLSGFTLEHNVRLHELVQSTSVEDSGSRNEGSTACSLAQTQHTREQMQRMREANFRQAMTEVTTLMDQKKATLLLLERGEQPVSPIKKDNNSATGALGATMTETKRERTSTFRKETRDARDNDEGRTKLTSLSANERVLARLEQIRSDDEARRALMMRVEEWKSKQHGDLNYVHFNKHAARELNAAAVVEQRRQVWRETSARVATARQRHRDIQRADGMRRMELRSMLEEELRSAEIARARMRGSPVDLRLSADHLRSLKWMLALTVARSAMVMRDKMLHHARSFESIAMKGPNAAAHVIQREWRLMHLRRGHKAKAMLVMQRYLVTYVMRRRIRRKQKATRLLIRVFEDASRRSLIAKHIRHFIYQCRRVQLAWRKHALVLYSQLELLNIQFDAVLKERKSPDSFLNADDHKIWLTKMQTKLTAVAQSHTREAQREMKREATKKNALEKNGGLKKEATQGELKSSKSLKGAIYHTDKVVQLDLDTKIEVLMRVLKDKRKSHYSQMMVWRHEKTKADMALKEQLEFEQIRNQFSAQRPGRDQSDHILELKSNLQQQLPKRPRFSILLSREKIVELIVQVLLATADKVSRGEEVDDSISLLKKHRAQKKKQTEQSSMQVG